MQKKATIPGSKLEGDWGEILALMEQTSPRKALEAKTLRLTYVAFVKSRYLLLPVILKTKWKYLSQMDMKFSDNLAKYI